MKKYSSPAATPQLENKAHGKLQKEKLHRRGIEPGLIAWKATMLTIIPPTLGNYK